MKQQCLILAFALFTAIASAVPQGPVGADLDKSGKSYEERKADQLEAMINKGWALYQAGELAGSRQMFEDVQLVDPENQDARTFLENTDQEWASHLADQRAEEAEQAILDAIKEQLKTPITIETKQPEPLHEFLRSLSFVSGIDFNIAPGVEAQVTAKCVDIPLTDVLDTTLKPYGITWEHTGAVVTISSALETKIFNLKRREFAIAKALYDEGVLQKTIWGSEGKPQSPDERIVLDERASTLMATDSRQRLEKLGALLQNLNQSISPALTTRFYKVEKESGSKIRALIDVVIKAETDTPFELERRVYLDGEDLIVRDSPERIAKIEELLRNEGFIEKLVKDELQIASFSLIPRDATSDNPEYLNTSFVKSVEEQLMTFLYSKEGITEAAAEGRKLWFNPNTMNFIMTDTPENINAVRDFLSTLPQLRTKERFKVIYLQHALADDMEGELSVFLGLARPDDLDGQDTVTKTMSQDTEFEFRDLYIYVRSVTGDTNAGSRSINDQAELLLRIKGGTSQTQTIQEKSTSIYFQDDQGGEYEIFADDIRPRGNTSSGFNNTTSTDEGRGTVKLEITYWPPK